MIHQLKKWETEKKEGDRASLSTDRSCNDMTVFFDGGKSGTMPMWRGKKSKRNKPIDLYKQKKESWKREELGHFVEWYESMIIGVDWKERLTWTAGTNCFVVGGHRGIVSF